jgi:hypothetical protein
MLGREFGLSSLMFFAGIRCSCGFATCAQMLRQQRWVGKYFIEQKRARAVFRSACAGAARRGPNASASSADLQQLCCSVNIAMRQKKCCFDLVEIEWKRFWSFQPSKIWQWQEFVSA